MTATLLALNATAAHAQEAPVGLGTAGNFSVLAGAEPTNTGPSFLGQSLGRYPGNTASGFETATIGGEVHLGDAVALQAQSDLTTAFNDAAGRTPFIGDLPGVDPPSGSGYRPARHVNRTLTQVRTSAGRAVACGLARSMAGGTADLNHPRTATGR
ncbi:hypothetical protein ACPFP2_06725 [Micromonospora citrea]|uniref:hypothetical protein n=1 Tax=Micromonospora citrea TaxID=47855 RepID=UPI003C5360A0